MEDLNNKEVEQRERVKTLTKLILEEGISQVELAKRVGVKPQYLSDVKNGRKPLTDNFAYQLGRKMGKKWQVLLGVSPVPQHLVGNEGFLTIIKLPVLSVPISGDPKKSKSWDSSFIEISGNVIPLIEQAENPYILRIPHTCTDDRLWPDDMVLIDQSPSNAAKYIIVENKGTLTLAKRTDEGIKNLADGTLLEEDELQQIGHIVTILMGRLVPFQNNLDSRFNTSY